MALSIRTHDPTATISLIESSLRRVGGAAPSNAFVCVGDVIDTDEDEGYLKGHGTQVLNERLVATVCGVVERINKLIYVKPLSSRYSAESGDVVVGRVTDIAGKRWKVDLHSRQEAGLQLTAVNLAGGVQRRRNAEDQLNMRAVFKEGDLISAEVQQLHQDGSIVLHTRSLKYGKLEGGQCVTVAPRLIKRQRQHFHTLEELGIDLIIGLNGIIWIAPHVPRGEDGAPLQQLHQDGPPLKQRQAACRIANAIRALSKLYLLVYPATILDAYELSIEHNVPSKDMIELPFLDLVAKSEAMRRHAAERT